MVIVGAVVMMAISLVAVTMGISLPGTFPVGSSLVDTSTFHKPAQLANSQ